MAEDKKGIEWMYEGPKSLVNREDYLLGKRIDKNFVMYSDVVTKDRDDRDDIFSKKKAEQNIETKPSASSTEGLSVQVARQQDPLAEIRLREIKRRQELMNNPMFKLKAEKMLKKEFEKAKRKAEKKAQKKLMKKARKDSNEEHNEEHNEKHHERTEKKHRRRESSTSSNKSSSEDSRKHRREDRCLISSKRHSPRKLSPRRLSPKRSSPNREKRSYKGDHRSNSPKRSSPNRERRSYKGDHRSNSPKRSSPNRERRNHRSRSPKRHSPERRHHKERREDRPNSSKKSEEMARRLQEMQANAKWKEQVRQDNVKFAENELAKESTSDKSTKNAVFIKAIQQRSEAKSVADKIQKNRHRLRIDRDSYLED